MKLALVLLPGCLSFQSAPGWSESFGYSSSEIHAIEIGDFGYPYVSVTIGDQGFMLPFDTGNMVGITLSSSLFDHLGLTEAGTYNRLSGSGKVMATLRIGQSQRVTVLDHDLGFKEIYEFDHPSLPGLLGPSFLDGSHFTLDYKSRLIGIAGSPLPEKIPNYRSVPLVRSTRYPTLILVHGTIEGHRILIELDTGKSRTVINPDLASKLKLEKNSRGVRISNIQIGDLSFEVPSAKESDQTSIKTGLPESILAGIGSDILSKFVWTVDYKAGVLWIPSSL